MTTPTNAGQLPTITADQAKAACKRIMSQQWEVYDSYDTDGKIIVWDGDEQSHSPVCDMGVIGDINYYDELCKAKIISAAPDMLNALIELTDAYSRLCNQHYSQSGKHTVFIIAQAAIDKATK